MNSPEFKNVSEAVTHYRRRIERLEKLLVLYKDACYPGKLDHVEILRIEVEYKDDT